MTGNKNKWIKNNGSKSGKDCLGYTQHNSTDALMMRMAEHVRVEWEEEEEEGAQMQTNAFYLH